jgi:hypothetical protein
MEPIAPIGVVRSPRTDFVNEGWGTVTAWIELDPDVFQPTAANGLTDSSHVEVMWALSPIWGSSHRAGRSVSRDTPAP